MNVNYEEVPNIITGKDLDYLSDMFEWNIASYKKTQQCSKIVVHSEIKAMIEKASTTFFHISQEVLNILGGANHE